MKPEVSIIIPFYNGYPFRKSTYVCVKQTLETMR